MVTVHEDELDKPLASSRDWRKEKLARRMNLLLDAWAFEKKVPLTYPQVHEYLTRKGLALSRPRWSYLISGNGFLVSEPVLLTALAELFEVEPIFLLDVDSEPSKDLTARLAFAQDLRELRVQRFAARNLAGVSPETLQLITDAIRSSREKRARMDQTDDTGV